MVDETEDDLDRGVLQEEEPWTAPSIDSVNEERAMEAKSEAGIIYSMQFIGEQREMAVILKLDSVGSRGTTNLPTILYSGSRRKWRSRSSGGGILCGARGHALRVDLCEACRVTS